MGQLCSKAAAAAAAAGAGRAPGDEQVPILLPPPERRPQTVGPRPLLELAATAVAAGLCGGVNGGGVCGGDSSGLGALNGDMLQLVFDMAIELASCRAREGAAAPGVAPEAVLQALLRQQGQLPLWHADLSKILGAPPPNLRANPT